MTHHYWLNHDELTFPLHGCVTRMLPCNFKPAPTRSCLWQAEQRKIWSTPLVYQLKDFSNISAIGVKYPPFPIQLEITIISSNDLRLPVSLPQPSVFSLNYFRHPPSQMTSFSVYQVPVKKEQTKQLSRVPSEAWSYPWLAHQNCALNSSRILCSQD